MLTMWGMEDEHRLLLERCGGTQLSAWVRPSAMSVPPSFGGC
ncbi:plasmid mobilization relaxosome protein MobC, partial [Citrobacter portucalensis]